MANGKPSLGRKGADARVGTFAYESLGYVLVASVVFCGIAYATGAFLLARRLNFFTTLGMDSMDATWGRRVSLALLACAVYVVCLALVSFIVASWHQHIVPEDGRLPDRIAHRTGLRQVELLTLVAGVAALVLAVFFGRLWVPLVVAATIPAAWSLGRRPYRRVVGGNRTIFVPPGLPPGNLTPLPGGDPSAPLPDGFVLVEYRWEYAVGLSRKDTFQVALPINIGLYDEFCALNASQPGVGEAGQNPYYLRSVLGITSEIRRLAEHVRAFAVQNCYGTLDEIGVAYSFIQDEDNVPYKSDLETKGVEEYYRYPLETLYERAGDCECKAIFLASLLITLDYSVVILEIPPAPGESTGHAAVGVEVPKGVTGNFAPVGGKRYFYLETTHSGWQLGELPPNVDGSGIKAWPLTIET